MITSLRNQRIVDARRLERRRERRATGRTTIDGPFLLHEAVTAGIAIHDLFATPDDAATESLAAAAGIAVTHVSSDVIDGLASSLHPRGPVAVVSVPTSARVRAVDSVVLWEISDPGNAGTIIRTAAAFGFQVLATADCVDLWSPKVLRAAVGGHFRTTISEGMEPDLARLTEVGLAPFATSAQGEDVGHLDIGLHDAVALIVGNEAHGLPEHVSGATGVTQAAIPMPGGTESLNAAVTAGIFMYLRSAKRGAI